MGFLKKIVSWFIPEQKQVKQQTGTDVTKASSDNHIKVIYGTRKTEGTIVFMNTTNPADGDDVKNDLLHIIIVWCEGGIESIDDILLNDISITDSKFNAKDGGRWAHARSYKNGFGTYSDTHLKEAGFDPASKAHRLDGLACTYLRLEWSIDDDAPFNGVPDVTAIIKGRRVKNLETGVTEYSENPAYCTIDYLTNPVFGKGLTGSEYDLDAFKLAGRIADTPVPKFQGSSETQPLFTCNAALDTGQSVLDNTEILSKSMRALMPIINGKITLIIEQDDEPTPFGLSENEFDGALKYDEGSKSKRYNRVIVEYIDKELSFSAQDAVYPDPTTDTELADQWLAEDNGILLEYRFKVSSCTNYYEARQMARILAMISRESLSFTVNVAPIGLRYTVGDVIPITHKKMGWVNKPFRLVNKTDLADGKFTFNLREHQPYIYNWLSGEARPPIPDTSLPDPRDVAEPVNFASTLLNDGNVNITWESEYSHFDIQIYKNNALIQTTTTITPAYVISALDAGDYELDVRAASKIGFKSRWVSFGFNVALPAEPVVNIDATTFNTITLSASVTGASLGTTFEWQFLGPTAEPIATPNTASGYNYIYTGLVPDTEYSFNVRTKNLSGVSPWVNVAVKTSLADLLDHISDIPLTKLSDDAQTLIEDINTQVDRLRPDTEGNLPELLNRTVNELNLERQARTDIEQGVFDLSANYTNWRQNYEQRQLGNERLIDAAVYIDPENGTIVNRAFAYTDEAFTEANVLIDGVNARIELQANRISQSDTRLSQAEAMLLVQAGQITQRATFTEIQSEIAGAIESLRPAYSWQFNSNNEGFSNVDSYNPQGYIVATAAINSPSINYIADENPMFRLRVRLHSGQQWIGEIIANNGEALINVPSPNNTDWQTLQVDATGTSGYTGNITSLELNLGACDIDFIEVGKRGANDLALNDITARTTELETDINAATGAMAQYATTTWVNQLGYQTQSNVNAIINAFDTTYQVSATLQTFDENGTLEKANNAQQFINGAEAYITNQITAFNAAEDGIDAKLSNVDQTLDALNGTISQNVVQVQGLELDLQDANLNDIINSVNQLLKNNELTQAGVKLSIAQSELQAKTTELEAQASQSLELATIFEQARGQITVLNQIVANEKQATVIRDERYLATFDTITARFSDVTTAIATIDEANTVRDQEFESFVADTISSFDEVTETFASQNQAFTTLEQSLTSKIDTDTEQAQSQAVAMAQEYTRTAVGYCVDANGDITSESDAVVCVADGGSWVAGPLAEYISNLQISDGESTASIKELKQVFKKVNGELVARGGWVLDNNGRAVSVAGYNDGETGNLDLVADVIRQGVMVNDAFVPTSYIDNTDPANPVHTFKGRMVLGDGHTVESLEDIRAQDGVDGKNGKDGTDGIPGANGADGQTTYTWVKYADSASGSGLSNSPTNKEYIGFAYNKTTATESTNPTDYKWSKVKGEDGTDGIPGAKGADGQTTYTWIAYSNNPNGSGMYQTPNENTLYIGIAVNKTTATESNQPADYTWSLFKGRDGNDGNDGRDGINGNNGVDGSRGSVSVQVATASGTWYDSTANAALPSAPVVHDRVTIYKTSDPKVQTTKRFNGSSWENYTLYVHGSAMIEDTLDGNVLRAGTRIESPRIDLIGDNFMKIELASGFGPDDLWYWMGPKIYKNGLPDLDSLTKGNAKEWKDRNANSFTVGTFISGAISNSVSTSQHTSSPTAELAFTSNGNNINFAVSYTHFRQIEGPQQGEPETVECPVAPTMTAVSGTVYLERNVNGSWLSVRSKTFSGTYNCQNGHYDLESRGERNTPYRSITNSNVSFTEIETPGTGYQQYRVRASLNNFFSTPKAGHYLSLAASE